MSLLGETRVVRRRYGAGAWVAGRWTSGTPDEVVFRGSVQRLSGRDFQGLIEGDRVRATRKIITTRCGFLRTDQQGGAEADEVRDPVSGRVYKVTHIDREHPLIRHEVAFLVEVAERSPQTTTGTLAALEAAVRDWLVTYGVEGGIPNADRAVVFARESGPRPPLPYLVVDVAQHDLRDGQDSPRVNELAEVEVRGIRRGVVSVTSYGDGAEAWLERAAYLLSRLDVSESLSDVGIALEPLGPLVDVGALIDTDHEARYQKDFALTYMRVPDADDAYTGVELGEVVQSIEQGELDLDHTVTLPP